MISLYVLGFVGNFASKILIDEKYDELINYFNVEFINHVKYQLDESLNEGGFNPSLIMPNNNSEQNRRGEHCEPADFKVIDIETIGKGGVLAALWKICDRNKWGLKYNLRKIPILQGTVEIANYFDLNPYRLLTKNSYIVACELEEASPHIFSNIGYITNEKKRVRIDGEAEAFLTKDFKDEIDKIIPNYTKKYKVV